MGRTAISASDCYSVREWAALLAAKAGPRDYKGQLEQIYNWLINNWRYVREPDEWIHGTARSLVAHVLGAKYNFPNKDPLSVDLLSKTGPHKGWGDCDDVATVVAAAARAIGHTPFFRVTFSSSGGAHVAAYVKTPAGDWVSVDPVGHPFRKFGWKHSAEKVQVFDLQGKKVDPKEGGKRTMITDFSGFDGVSEASTSKPHYCAVPSNDVEGPRALGVPMRCATLLKRGIVLNGMPAIDEKGRKYKYDADRDLWISEQLAGSNLENVPAHLGGLDGFFRNLFSRKGRARIRKNIRRAIRNPFKWAKRTLTEGRLRNALGRVYQNPIFKKAAGVAGQIIGVPAPVTESIVGLGGKALVQSSRYGRAQQKRFKRRYGGDPLNMMASRGVGLASGLMSAGGGGGGLSNIASMVGGSRGGGLSSIANMVGGSSGGGFSNLSSLFGSRGGSSIPNIGKMASSLGFRSASVPAIRSRVLGRSWTSKPRGNFGCVESGMGAVEPSDHGLMIGGRVVERGPLPAILFDDPELGAQIVAMRAKQHALARRGLAGVEEGGHWELEQDGVSFPAAPVVTIAGVPGLYFGELEVSSSPKPGSWYRIRRGDTLFGITSRAYGVKPGSKRLKMARWINSAAANSKVVNRSNRSKFFPGGMISFSPMWSADADKAIDGVRGNKFAVIWIPEAQGDEPPEKVEITQPNDPKTAAAPPKPLVPNKTVLVTREPTRVEAKEPTKLPQRPGPVVATNDDDDDVILLKPELAPFVKKKKPAPLPIIPPGTGPLANSAVGLPDPGPVVKAQGPLTPVVTTTPGAPPPAVTTDIPFHVANPDYKPPKKTWHPPMLPPPVIVKLPPKVDKAPKVSEVPDRVVPRPVPERVPVSPAPSGPPKKAIDPTSESPGAPAGSGGSNNNLLIFAGIGAVALIALSKKKGRR